MPELDGKVALVTGAARGLGAVIVKELAAAGADVLGVDLEGADIQADIGTAEGNRDMVQGVIDRFGRLDILVLNAGVQHVSPIRDLDEKQWDRLHNVMLKGPYLSLRAAWDRLVESGGRVVVISSTSGIAAEIDKSPYVSAKAGVLGLVREAALEGGRDGIAINAVAPGWMRTPMAEAQLEAAVSRGITYEQALESMLSRQPIKRFVETSEVAAAVRFLAGPAASGITGVCLPVDLGLLAC